GVRVETGVRQGDAISPYYDPMIAKLVTHGESRNVALTKLLEALEATEIAGSVGNTAFLSALAADEDFAAGDVDTGLIARKQEQLTALPEPQTVHLAAAALAAADLAVDTAAADPWAALAGYAHFNALEKQVRLGHADDEDVIARLTVAANGNASVTVG